MGKNFLPQIELPSVKPTIDRGQMTLSGLTRTQKNMIKNLTGSKNVKNIHESAEKESPRKTASKKSKKRKVDVKIECAEESPKKKKKSKKSKL